MRLGNTCYTTYATLALSTETVQRNENGVIVKRSAPAKVLGDELAKRYL